jgi:hypothetical protein
MGSDRFSGVAYSGAPIDHPWWGRLLIDVAGTRLHEKLPALREHKRDRIVGVIEGHSKDGGALRIEGSFVSSTTDANEVLALARAGFPWRFSIGAWAEAVEEIKAGVAVTVNGRSVQGPAVVWRRTRIGEVSFVSVPADEGAAVDRIAASAGLPRKGATMVTFESEVSRLVAQGSKRAEALRMVARQRPDLHESFLRRHRQIFGGPPPDGVVQFDAAVDDLVEREGLTRGAAIRKVQAEAPGLFAAYVRGKHAQMGHGEVF